MGNLKHKFGFIFPGLPWGLSWWRICLQCWRPGFDPWVGTIPWRRERLPTPVFWPGEFHGLYSPWVTKSWTQLSDFHFHFLRVSLIALIVGKQSACKAGDPGLIPGLGRSAGEGIGYPLQYCWASLGTQLVKNLPAMLETWVWSLGWEDPLEKGKATHSSILAWRIPWTVYPLGLKESDMTEQLSLSLFQKSMVSRSLWWRGGLVVACCRVGGTVCSSTHKGSFEGGYHYLHYLHHSLAPGK